MKNINKAYLVLVLILCLIISLCSGCTRHLPPEEPINRQGQETINIVDCVGREVTIPANPQRIACLCPASGHALAMYGQGDKIIASVDGMKRDVLLVEMYPHIIDVPKPKTSGIINIEELAACNPDLVFVKGDTSSNEAEVEKMNKAKIPFLVVEFSSMKEQQYAMEMIGKAVGEEGEARRYNQYYDSCLKRVKDGVVDIPEKDRMRIYHSLNEATRTDCRGTLPADWTQAAGVINVSVDRELKLVEGKYYASLEQILLWDPDYVLTNDPNVVGYITNHEQWAPLKAVKNQRVLPLPNGISRWGHDSSLETPLVVLWTAKTMYPERFADIDMKEETKGFYREFFDFELSDETVDKILSGQEMRISKQEQYGG